MKFLTCGINGNKTTCVWYTSSITYLTRQMFCNVFYVELKVEECYLNNHLVDNLCDNYNLQRKNRYLHENQNNKEIKLK